MPWGNLGEIALFAPKAAEAAKRSPPDLGVAVASRRDEQQQQQRRGLCPTELRHQRLIPARSILLGASRRRRNGHLSLSGSEAFMKYRMHLFAIASFVAGVIWIVSAQAPAAGGAAQQPGAAGQGAGRGGAPAAPAAPATPPTPQGPFVTFRPVTDAMLQNPSRRRLADVAAHARHLGLQSARADRPQQRRRAARWCGRARSARACRKARRSSTTA